MACSQSTSVGGSPPPDPNDLGSHAIPTVGVDADGDTHYYDSRQHRIAILDGDRVRTQPLGEHELAEWVETVAEEIGWAQTSSDLLARDVRRAAGVEE